MTKKNSLIKQVLSNRVLFLEAMRSGNYKKGTIKTDDRGMPIIESPEDEGFCAVGLMYSLFDPIDRRLALKVTHEQCSRIQHQWNDSSLTFPQIADLIEYEIFRE